MLVYLLVFSVMLKIQTADYEHYWLFLLSGLPVWVFFATSLQSSSRSLLENANLIEIKAVTTPGSRVNEFPLNVSLERPKEEPEKGAKPAPKPPAAK